MKRAIKRTVAPPGKHTLIVSLLPLLCAALLLLSGCRSERMIRPSNNRESVTDSDATTTAVDNGATPGTTNDGATAELPPHALTRDILPAVARRALDTLSAEVSYVSDKLAAMESEATEMKDVLLQAETWLQYLTVLKEKAQTEFTVRYGADADTVAPGLEKFSVRLELMLRVIRSNLSTEPSQNLQRFQNSQETLKKLNEWVNELTERAQALPDLPLAERPAVPELGPKSSVAVVEDEEDEMSAILGELSDKVDALSVAENDILQRLDSILAEPPRVSLGVFGVAFFIFSALSLAFSILLFLAVRTLARQQALARQQSGTFTGREKARDDISDTLEELSDKVSSLVERIDDMSQIARPVDEIPQSSALPQKPEYFKVISSNGAGAVYLWKQPHYGDIYGMPSKNNPQTYDIFPAMSQTTDNGTRGMVNRNRLIFGDIKRCFDIPKALPAGEKLFVTVKESALIGQTGNQYALLKLGKLSVTGAP